MPVMEPPHVSGGRWAEPGWVLVASPHCPKLEVTHLFSALNLWGEWEGGRGEAERTQPGFGCHEPSEHGWKEDV